MSRRIVPFASLTAGQRAEAARILREALAHVESGYNAPGEAEAEVRSVLDDGDRFGFAMIDGARVVGWIGCIRNYASAWELHPLVIDPPFQRQGLGAQLTAALEEAVARNGVLTLYLGADDDFGGTSLFGADVFPDVLARLAAITDVGGHPFGFYRRLGYEVVGLIPAANGFGKPDILMAKRVGKPSLQ